ncbi:2Fe-2S iron-sulfur cluster binding domain-containing protein [Chitinimonas sp. JJ19]|uniref:2Fe-2S iron-sulfur cluster binding domain-containing protein n=1 Tax=Chitinimonas sp. JJ19 TaxID=3109352 RepID=UPI001A4BF0C2|nr:(2Fe-2S)-binding protein [Chitinimonas sp.]
MTHYTLDFPDSPHPSIQLPEGSALSLQLSALNSPLLFGCRAGLCGTCLIELQPGTEGSIAPAGADEREALEIYAPDQPLARLACQVHVTGDMRIRKL